jgi:hypothetical protein
MAESDIQQNSLKEETHSFLIKIAMKIPNPYL